MVFIMIKTGMPLKDSVRTGGKYRLNYEMRSLELH